MKKERRRETGRQRDTKEDRHEGKETRRKRDGGREERREIRTKTDMKPERHDGREMKEWKERDVYSCSRYGSS